MEVEQKEEHKAVFPLRPVFPVQAGYKVLYLIASRIFQIFSFSFTSLVSSLTLIKQRIERELLERSSRFFTVFYWNPIKNYYNQF